LPARAQTSRGALGAVLSGVTALDGVEGALVPIAFDAVTVKV
jgi:hypothetical protein